MCHRGQWADWKQTQDAFLLPEVLAGCKGPGWSCASCGDLGKGTLPVDSRETLVTDQTGVGFKPGCLIYQLQGLIL